MLQIKITFDFSLVRNVLAVGMCKKIAVEANVIAVSPFTRLNMAYFVCVSVTS